MKKTAVIATLFLSAQIASGQIRLERDPGVFLSGGIEERRGVFVVDLTEGGATSLIRVGITQGSWASGNAEITIFATDGTDYQITRVTANLACINKAGTETCNANYDAADLFAASTGTLSCTNSYSTTPSNAADLTSNCTSSLSQTLLRAWVVYTIHNASSVTQP